MVTEKRVEVGRLQMILKADQQEQHSGGASGRDRGGTGRTSDFVLSK